MRTAGRCITSVAALLVGAAGPALPVVPPMFSALCPKPKPGEIIVCADVERSPSPFRLPLGSAPVAGDRDVEIDETLVLTLSNASGGTARYLLDMDMLGDLLADELIDLRQSQPTLEECRESTMTLDNNLCGGEGSISFCG